jgi:hypothetical protein
MLRLALIVGLVWGLACGGGDDPPLGPQPLEPDPAVLTGCVGEPPAAGESRAKWVECEDELPAGRLVSGRLGDVVLANDRVAVVIRGHGEGYYLMGTAPGGVVDAARHGADDQIKELLPILALQGGGFDEIVITEAGDDGPATVVVRGPVEPVPFIAAAVSTTPVDAVVEQHYVLEPDSDALLIRTYLHGDGVSLDVGDALFFGGVIRSWVPGTGVLEGSANVPLVASTGAGGTSYGLVYPPEATPAIRFADIANVKLAFGPSRTTGGPPVERWLIIGDGSSASVTEQAWTLRGQALGTVTGTTEPDLEVAVVAADGDPITTGRAGADGSYRVALPPGDYTLQAGSAGHAPGTPAQVTVTAGGQPTADLAAGGSGTLAVAVTDGDGDPVPARVVIRQGDTRRIEYAGPDGALTLPLAPGDYRVDVSRGMEYDAFSIDPLTIADGQATEVDATLNRVVDTAGWISVDPHIHSEMSTDSQVPLDVRLLSIAAEGVEVPISTDHDFVSDYGPVVAELGLSAWVAPQVGVEASSLVWGHVNSWPLVPDYDRAGGDAVPWYDRSPGDVYDLMRARGDHVVIQLNHPRHPTSGAFETLRFNAETLMAERDPTALGLPGDTNLSDFDFDTLEVANDFSADQFADSFHDWLALVAGGHPAVATGSSDSHGRSAYIGNSRTYVYVGPGADDPATLDGDAVNEALVAGKAVVAQGAFVTAAIVDPGTGQPAAPGALVDLSGQSEAELHIRVQAPPWMPLARIVVYAGREIAATVNLDSAETQVLRHDAAITIPIDDADGFFVVLVEAAGPGAPVLGQPAGSFTNPLRYDADGDQMWMP